MLGLNHNGLAQQGIHFIESISLSNALNLAQQSGKNIFIDTYADWCIPCKKMEVEFKNNEVSNFFNKNYVNVRINMDNSSYADEYRNHFNIVFLPTMIILDQSGNIKYITDKITPGRELLAIAKNAQDPFIFFESETAKVQSSPVERKKKNNKQTKKSGEKIVYASGADGQNHNPDFLYKEAYFRIELMDGSHWEKARQYLETQSDWLTPKNMRFIVDFMHNVHSEEFKFFARNIDIFKKEIGEKQINLSLRFIVNDRLEYGYPRPSFEEAMALYRLMDTVHYEQLAYEYYLFRLINECKFDEFDEYASKYLQDVNPNDHAIMYTSSEVCLARSDVEDSELIKCRQHLENAVEIAPSIPYYHEALARVYLMLGKKRKAKKSLEITIKLLEENKNSTAVIDDLKSLLFNE